MCRTSPGGASTSASVLRLRPRRLVPAQDATAIVDWRGDPPNGSCSGPVRRLRLGRRSSTTAPSDLSSQKAGVAFIKLIVARSHERASTSSTSSSSSAGWSSASRPSSGGGDVNAGRLLQQAGDRHAHAGVDQAARAVLDLLARDPPIDPRIASTSPSRASCRCEPTSTSGASGDHLTLPDDWGKLGRPRLARSTSRPRPTRRRDHATGTSTTTRC